MEINTVKSAAPAPTYNSAPKRNAEVAREVVQPQAANAEVDPSNEQQVKDLSQVEKQRLDTVVQGAHAFKNTLGASGMTFSIFKDSSGQFITRFTNKDTGAVTYIPEPNILKFSENTTSSLLAVEA